MDTEAVPDGTGFLAGGGEMGALMRAHDWTATPVGMPAIWPQPLKTAVRLMLTTRHPMFIWWGETLTCFYNDAYRALIGPDRHPSALGRPGREVWAEIWDVIGPQIELVMAGQGATWHERHLIPITRGDRREDVWWTYGYSPIDDEAAPDGVGGVLVVCRDVTAEVRAEQAHAGEAERLRQFFEQAPGFMALLRGPEHVLELTNAAYIRLAGRDVQGRPVRDAFPEITGQGFFELLDRVYATGEAATAHRAPVTLASGPDGTLQQRFLNFVYQPVRDAAGTVTGVFVEGNDVTEAKLAEDALRASEARQALLLELVRTQRATDDPEAMMRAASEAVGRHLGVNRVGFFLMPDDDTLRFTAGWADGNLDQLHGTFPALGIGPAYLAAVRKGVVLGIADVTQDLLTAGSRFAEIGTRASIGVPIIRNGRWHAGMYVNHASPRDWTAEEVALVRDVAEQTWDAVERAHAVQAERALNAALEQRVEERTRERDMVWRTSQDLLMIVGFDGLSRSANPAWTKALGYAPAELIGRRFDALVHPDDLAATGRNLARLTGGAVIRDLDIRLRARDGSYRLYSWHVIPEGDQFYAAGRDMTERRQLEEQLRQAQKMEVVGQLTGGIAHDFNNLLQGITGALGLLQRRVEEGRTADLQRFVGIATEAAQRAAALTQRLLAFARRQPLDPQPVDANRLLVSMRELLERSLGSGIEFKMILADGLWPALCDANQLENTILNLAINARDAMPDGGRLTMETANAERNGAGTHAI
jgi:PAS domain S-box-containing protein